MTVQAHNVNNKNSTKFLTLI